VPKYQLDPKYHFNTETRSVENTRTGIAIPQNEPVMLFRATDAALVPMLEAYFSECTRLAAPQSHLQSIMERIHEIRMWQRAHADKVKRPD
jgi:hypothetical protein